MIYLVLIPLGLLVVPWWLVKYVFVTEATRNLPYRPNARYLWVASAIWIASQLLPDVAISPETDSFTMHFCGGVVAAVLYLYTLKAYKLHLGHSWQLWVGLFLFASGLGVLNELFEFIGYKLNFMPIPATMTRIDTWWDLVANTLGSLSTLAIVRLVWHNRGRTHP
jgi:hypothetical protein